MTFKEHLNRNIKLAVPVMITQIGQISVNIVDNIMVGGIGGKLDYIKDPNLGKSALAAVSLGNAIFITLLVIAFGFSFALSPLIANADAKKDSIGVAKYFTHSLVLNVLLSVLLFGCVFLIRPLAFYMNQPQDVVNLMIPYLTIMAFSLVPLMIFQTYRQFAEGISLTVAVTIATILANVINFIFNYILIFGYFGFPRMGVAGSAWGTFIARFFMMIFLIVVLYNWKKSGDYLRQMQWKKFNWIYFRELLKLGIPGAMTSFFEISAFALAAFVCGYTFNNSLLNQELARNNLAAHQIAISLASSTFMMCAGLGVAATVRVGNQLGLKDFKTLREAGWSTVLMVVVFMFFCGILIIVFRYSLPLIYIDNKIVIDLAAKLLVIAAFFQLSDGVQLVALGALRGLQDVFIPSVITFVSYWLIAIPLGTILAIHFEMRAFGMWIGLGTGLTISAVLLIIRYHIKTNKLIHKLNKNGITEVFTG